MLFIIFRNKLIKSPVLEYFQESKEVDFNHVDSNNNNVFHYLSLNKRCTSMESYTEAFRKHFRFGTSNNLYSVDWEKYKNIIRLMTIRFRRVDSSTFSTAEIWPPHTFYLIPNNKDAASVITNHVLKNIKNVVLFVHK